MRNIFIYCIENIQILRFKITQFLAGKFLECLGLHSILLIEAFLETCHMLALSETKLDEYVDSEDFC